MGVGGAGWMVGSAENKANSAQLELGLGLSLAMEAKSVYIFAYFTAKQKLQSKPVVVRLQPRTAGRGSWSR